MELKDFIKETLTQITYGVKEAQEQIKDTGAYINPEGFPTRGAVKPGYDNEYRSIQNVKMSIVVSAVENSEIKGKAGIISVISLGLSGKVSDINSVTNRIEVEIPLSLPVMDVDK